MLSSFCARASATAWPIIWLPPPLPRYLRWTRVNAEYEVVPKTRVDVGAHELGPVEEADHVLAALRFERELAAARFFPKRANARPFKFLERARDEAHVTTREKATTRGIRMRERDGGMPVCAGEALRVVRGNAIDHARADAPNDVAVPRILERRDVRTKPQMTAIHRENAAKREATNQTPNRSRGRRWAARCRSRAPPFPT